MKIALCSFLFIMSLLNPPRVNLKQVSAKDNLNIYINNDGMGGNTYLIFHARNKSTNQKITFTVKFSTDGQFPTAWNQTFTLQPTQDQIIGVRWYPNCGNLTYCDLISAEYVN